MAFRFLGKGSLIGLVGIGGYYNISDKQTQQDMKGY